jgi:hypothetical protein
MNRKILVSFAIVVLTAALTGCQSNEETQPLSAIFSETIGAVAMKQADEAEFSEAGDGAVLNVDGQVQTGEDGRVRLDLSTGTIIRVTPSSVFTLVSNEEIEGGLLTKIKLEAGKIFIILKGGQADVETPSGVASVRGSYLKVEIDPVTGDIYITCLEGTCSATNPDGVQVIFTNGQRVTLFHQNSDGTWNSPLLGSMTLEEFEEWLENNNDSETKKYYDEGIAKLLEEATQTPTEEATETPTEAPTGDSGSGGSNACSQLAEPGEGSALGKAGQTQFSWSETTGAEYYILRFVNEDGSSAIIQTTGPSAEFYIEVLPLGGNYEWFVTAYGSDGTLLCTSAAGHFSKPKADPTEKPKPEGSPEPPAGATEPPATEPPATEPPSTEEPYCEECQY